MEILPQFAVFFAIVSVLVLDFKMAAVFMIIWAILKLLYTALESWGKEHKK